MDGVEHYRILVFSANQGRRCWSCFDAYSWNQTPPILKNLQQESSLFWDWKVA